MNRAPLKLPLRSLLDDTLPEEDVHGLWSRIVRGRMRSASRAPTWGVALAFGIVILVVLFSVLRAQNPVALRLLDHREVPSVVLAANDTALSLDDGSVISVAGGSRLEVLESTGKAFSVALRYGRTVFDVRPGGRRTWRVECGSIAVEVVGTRFTVDRSLARVSVSVERGAVLVRGDAVPDRVLRLAAGKSVTLETVASGGDRASASLSSPASATSAKGEPTAADTVVRRAPLPLEGLPVEPPDRDSRSHEDRVAASASAPSTALGNEEAPFEDDATRDPAGLFQAADTARRQGRTDEAARWLKELLAKYPTDSRAPLAELTLGRMYLDTLERPGVAAEHLARALRLGLPAALAEDAAGRVVEAYARAGNSQLAKDARARYRTMYPNGARTEYVDRWAPPGR